MIFQMVGVLEEHLGEATGKFNGEVIDFYQQDNHLSLKQSKKRKKIYEELMKIPVKII